jgi:hypothetical protein
MRFVLSLAFIFFAGVAHAADPELRTWDLRTDFRSSPNQENPNRDQYGSADTWQFLQAGGLNHSPSTYSLYQSYVLNFNDVTGLEAWTNGFIPEVSINPTT